MIFHYDDELTFLILVTIDFVVCFKVSCFCSSKFVLLAKVCSGCLGYYF